MLLCPSRQQDGVTMIFKYPHTSFHMVWNYISRLTPCFSDLYEPASSQCLTLKTISPFSVHFIPWDLIFFPFDSCISTYSWSLQICTYSDIYTISPFHTLQSRLAPPHSLCVWARWASRRDKKAEKSQFLVPGSAGGWDDSLRNNLEQIKIKTR